MIIRSEELKDICSKILTAVDSSELSAVTETLQLETKEQFLYISVTNREYFVTVSIPTDSDEELHAVISASLFLSIFGISILHLFHHIGFY